MSIDFLVCNESLSIFLFCVVGICSMLNVRYITDVWSALPLPKLTSHSDIEFNPWWKLVVWVWCLQQPPHCDLLDCCNPDVQWHGLFLHASPQIGRIWRPGSQSSSLSSFVWEVVVKPVMCLACKMGRIIIIFSFICRGIFSSKSGSISSRKFQENWCTTLHWDDLVQSVIWLCSHLQFQPEYWH